MLRVVNSQRLFYGQKLALKLYGICKNYLSSELSLTCFYYWFKWPYSFFILSFNPIKIVWCSFSCLIVLSLSALGHLVQKYFNVDFWLKGEEFLSYCNLKQLLSFRRYEIFTLKIDVYREIHIWIIPLQSFSLKDIPVLSLSVLLTRLLYLIYLFLFYIST